jgi:DNA-binding NarL/FixJ family response regulator
VAEKTIYTVDDYPLAAYTTKRTVEALSRHQCNIIDFESPIVLLHRFQKDFENIDMVITDFEMPNLRGDELIKELRKVKPEIKIVVTSAWLDTSSSEGKELIGKEVKALNPDLILAKPYPENWVNMIDDLLEN